MRFKIGLLRGGGCDGREAVEVQGLQSCIRLWRCAARTLGHCFLTMCTHHWLTDQRVTSFQSTTECANASRPYTGARERPTELRWTVRGVEWDEIDCAVFGHRGGPAPCGGRGLLSVGQMLLFGRGHEIFVEGFLRVVP